MLELDRPRDLGAILSTCFGLYRSHFVVFAGLALAVIVPLELLTLGLIDGQLTSGFEDDGLFGGGPAYNTTQTLLVVPLITGTHVAAVMTIGAGSRPTLGDALGSAGAALLPLIGAVLLVGLAVLAGLIALIVPGVFLYVRLFVVAQVVAAEKLGPAAAMSRSWALVAGNWWRTLGIGIVLGLIAGLVGLLLGGIVSAIAAAADSGLLLMIGTMLFDAVVLSFTALGGTLLYFDLRARHEPPPAGPVGDTGLDRPEAPPGT